jgi:hypothetical protein
MPNWKFDSPRVRLRQTRARSTSAWASNLAESILACIRLSVMRPDVGELDPVAGRKRAYWPGTFCSMERALGGCGPDGKNWQPKQPPEPVGFVDDDPPPRTGGAMAEPE